MNSGRLTDFEKILVKMPLSSLILAFVLHTIVFYRFTSINETSSIILFAVMLVCFIGCLIYWMIESFVINGFVYIADYLIILFNWIAKMLDRAAYYWLKNRTDGDLLGENILDSFSKKNNFFIFHKNGVQKVILERYKENNLPVFCQSESSIFSFDKFFSVLIDDSLKDYFKRLNVKATRKFRNHFSLNGKEELIEYAENIAEKIKDKVEHKVNENSFIEGKYIHSQTEKLLAKILNKSLKSFRQKLILESRDSIQETTIGLRNLLYNEIRREDKKKNDDFCNASILPANTKFLLSKQNLNIFVIEQAPQRRTIRYHGCPYFLSFPYVVFIVSFAGDTFETLHVFYSNKPLKSLNDTAYYSSFNNVSDGGMVCVGTVKDELQLMEGSLGRKADEVISAFWQSNFNTDIDDCFDRYENDLIDYGTWAEKSREQPDFFSTISLLECDSFRNIIDGMIDEEFSETSDFNRAKKLRELIDSWFEANESNIREKVSKTWSNISLDEFSTKEVEGFMVLRNVEIDNLLGLVKKLCLDCVNDKSIPKDFLVKLIKSFEESVRDDFNPLLSSVPFKLNVSFSKMFNQINM